MADIESVVSGYKKYLAELTPKFIDNSTYGGWIERYVKLLSSRTIDFGNDLIIGYLDEYVRIAHEKKDFYPEVYEKVKQPTPFLGDIQWAMDTIIKEMRYPRLKIISSEAHLTNLKSEIAHEAIQMHYSDAVNFMGELAGAWVTSYPIASIVKYEQFVSPRKNAPKEEYFYILARRLEIDFLERIK